MLTPLPNNHYIVELPEGASYLNMTGDMFQYFVKEDPMALFLPPGDYSLSFTRDTQTEDGWKEVVKFTIAYSFHSYTQSGHSLLESLGIKGNWIIIKKQ